MTESWPPAGVRFFPADDILITEYLANRISGNPLPVYGAVAEADVYGKDANPSQLFLQPDASWQTRVDPCGKFIDTESVRYVFTRLAKVGNGTGNKNRSRVAGAGFWHGNNATAVENEAGTRVGNKKTFKYKGDGTVDLPAHTVYIMNEYSTLCCEDVVLCKVKMIRREKRINRLIDNVDDSANKKSRSNDDTSVLDQVYYVDALITSTNHDQDTQESYRSDQDFLDNQSTGTVDDDMEMQAFFMDTCY